jgi:hypothetical protein
MILTDGSVNFLIESTQANLTKINEHVERSLTRSRPSSATTRL